MLCCANKNKRAYTQAKSLGSILPIHQTSYYMLSVYGL